MTPDLTDTEIDLICDGYVQNHARVMYLRRMGLTVRQKPNGKPLVNRAHYDAIMNPSTKTNRATANGPAWSVAA